MGRGECGGPPPPPLVKPAAARACGPMRASADATRARRRLFLPGNQHAASAAAPDWPRRHCACQGQAGCWLRPAPLLPLQPRHAALRTGPAVPAVCCPTRSVGSREPCPPAPTWRPVLTAPACWLSRLRACPAPCGVECRTQLNCSSVRRPALEQRRLCMHLRASTLCPRPHSRLLPVSKSASGHASAVAVPGGRRGRGLARTAASPRRRVAPANLAGASACRPGAGSRPPV